MYSDFKTLLIEAGLSEAEALLYIELLKKPAFSRWELVLRTGFDRNKIYRAFDKLKDLKMISEEHPPFRAASIDFLIDDLGRSREKVKKLIEKLKRFVPFLKTPAEAIKDFEILNTSDAILEKYIMMSEIKYDICFDFGDLESFIPVLGGIESVFKFRQKRFDQNAKNEAVCTSIGPFTSCMMRKKDLNYYKSNIELLDLNFDGSLIVFSDTNDYVMFNYFKDEKNPSSVLVRSKTLADTQRLQFKQFQKSIEKFS